MTQRESQEQRIPKRDDPGKGPQGIAPDMQARTVTGIFDRPEPIEALLADLRAAGYRDEDISVVMQQQGAVPELGAGDTKASEGTVAGASVGAVLGGIVGLAALAIPGVGPLLAAGPIAAALGALTGGALGGLVGSFSGLGIPTEHAQDYEAAVRSGGVVVALRVADRESEERASEILRRHGARQVAGYTQAL
jgi:hypothetical protein